MRKSAIFMVVAALILGALVCVFQWYCFPHTGTYFVEIQIAVDAPPYRGNPYIVLGVVFELVPICLFICGVTMYLVWNLRHVINEAESAAQMDEDRPWPPPPNRELRR